MKNVPTTKCFQDLIVWQKAHELVLGVYELTKGFPKSEMFGLTAQLRSAAVSVPANIAEGYKRRSRADKIRLLIAQGSLEESRYYLILSEDLAYSASNPLSALLESVSKLLDRYIQGIERSSRAR